VNRRNSRWLVIMAAGLVVITAIILAIHYAIFRDARNLFFYLLLDIGFLPLQVLIVGLILERIISVREKRALTHKLNMVIGAFFSELGIKLLGLLTGFIVNREGLMRQLAIGTQWMDRDWKQALDTASKFSYQVDAARMDLAATRDLLAANRPLLTLLLANPNLMEHERFTDLLWAVSHLLEELTARSSLEGLPASDLAHLAGDVRRVYSQLTVQWLLYSRHLQSAYPYIFSIMVRTHPLQDSPSAVVR
jgi:hypothetical protein